jgi:hypothetical protein
VPRGPVTTYQPKFIEVELSPVFPSIKEIEPVHQPKNRQNVEIKLPNKLDLSRVNFRIGPSVIKSRFCI